MLKNPLNILSSIYLFVIFGIIIFLLGGYIYFTLAVDYPDFFKSKKVRKRFAKDVKNFFKSRFSKEKQQETRTIILITIMAIVVAIVTFLFD